MFCLKKHLGLNVRHFAKNPLTGSVDFGFFPKIVHAKYHFEPGPIRLKYGQHFGPNRGYGISHIWAEHWKWEKCPNTAMGRIIQHVSAIIRPNQPIHCEFSQMADAPRTTVCRSGSGIAILQEQQDGNGVVYYSVVTAFNGKAHGQRIGSVV